MTVFPILLQSTGSEIQESGKLDFLEHCSKFSCSISSQTMHETGSTTLVYTAFRNKTFGDTTFGHKTFEVTSYCDINLITIVLE